MIETLHPGDRVFISEYGYGARAGKVEEIANNPGHWTGHRHLVVVKLDHQDCPRTVYPEMVFRTAAEAEADSR